MSKLRRTDAVVVAAPVTAVAALVMAAAPVSRVVTSVVAISFTASFTTIGCGVHQLIFRFCDASEHRLLSRASKWLYTISKSRGAHLVALNLHRDFSNACERRWAVSQRPGMIRCMQPAARDALKDLVAIWSAFEIDGASRFANVRTIISNVYANLDGIARFTALTCLVFQRPGDFATGDFATPPDHTSVLSSMSSLKHLSLHMISVKSLAHLPPSLTDLNIIVISEFTITPGPERLKPLQQLSALRRLGIGSMAYADASYPIVELTTADVGILNTSLWATNLSHLSMAGFHLPDGADLAFPKLTSLRLCTMKYQCDIDAFSRLVNRLEALTIVNCLGANDFVTESEILLTSHLERFSFKGANAPMTASSLAKLLPNTLRYLKLSCSQGPSHTLNRTAFSPPATFVRFTRLEELYLTCASTWNADMSWLSELPRSLRIYRCGNMKHLWAISEPSYTAAQNVISKLRDASTPKWDWRHPHRLVYVDVPYERESGKWFCDVCMMPGTGSASYQCRPCRWDAHEECIESHC